MSHVSAARDVGVQSWSFREFKTPAALIAKLREVGVTSTELCAVQADFNDPTKHAAPIAELKAAGQRIVSIGVQTFTGNVAVERQWFEFAKAAGAKHISAHFKVDSFRDAIKVVSGLSEAYGIKVGIHCHGGYMFGGSLDAIEHMIAIGGGYIGANIDTAWCMQAGGNPVQWIQKLGKNVIGVHYKDFVFDRAGKWSETVIGEGNLPLKDTVQALDDVGFSGMAVIEYEADTDNPAPAITRCVQAIRAL